MADPTLPVSVTQPGRPPETRVLSLWGKPLAAWGAGDFRRFFDQVALLAAANYAAAAEATPAGVVLVVTLPGGATARLGPVPGLDITNAFLQQALADRGATFQKG